MTSVRIELLRFVGFLRAQVPRLHKATLESHGVGLIRVLAWVFAIQLAFGILNPVSAVGLAVSGTLPFALWVGASGAWIQHKRKVLNWDEWFEFGFLCALPVFGISLILALLPGFVWPLSIAGLGHSAYLFYAGVKNRYPLPEEKDYFLLKGAVFVFLVLGIGAQLRTQWVLTDINANLYLPSLMKSELKDDPKGPLSASKIKAVRALYPGDNAKQNAAEQFAHSIWSSLEPDDLEAVRILIEKAVYCIRQNKLEREDMIKIESIVLDTTRLTRMYLETDYLMAGVYQLNVYGPEACGAQ